MLKTHAASALLQRSRITLAATSSSPSSSSPASPAAKSPITTPIITMPSSHDAHAPPPPQSQQQLKDQRPPESAYFPLGYKEAAYQWWSSVTPSMAEHNVLSLIPHVREATKTPSSPNTDPHGPRFWRRSLVQLSGKNRALNQVCIQHAGLSSTPPDETLVMIHGYGAGLGFFYKNLEPISRIPGLRLYALDMLGMGNSSRPCFKIHAKEKNKQVMEAEDWFIDALEEWRKERKLDRFTLLGHSLGGYLAVSYAIKYPGHLNKLILASPVGIPEDPYAINASMPDPKDSSLAQEFTQDQQSVVDNSTISPHTSKNAAVTKAKDANAPKRPLPAWLVWLWDANVSPFSLVRLTGPLGPRLVSGWSSRRFNHLPTQEAQALHNYSFSIFKQRGSGEYALAYILAPGAYARRPIINRIHEVGRQSVAHPDGSRVKETGIPIVFMYGENDWMDVAGGLAAEQRIKETSERALRQAASPQDQEAENGSAKVVIIPRSGHHLYLDNPDEFNRVIREEIEDTMQHLKKTRPTAS
ncbi:hypothetical protein CDD82_5825 [Ophiocordyceps australis]|uniref:AB hydrolase-1 domain-containing protein n=1 Tax=Ophiocordyceps australis TaxID=1399860 RepID=A0A2C5Y3N7_9HYPO|nr:hypothetical protein CDD82_5825 [Ophiocordyceps australis]